MQTAPAESTRARTAEKQKRLKTLAHIDSQVIAESLVGVSKHRPQIPAQGVGLCEHVHSEDR